MKTVRRLLEDGLAHAAATDIHGPNDQRAIAAGMAWIKKRLGEPALERLLDHNPRRILLGELPDGVSPAGLRPPPRPDARVRYSLRSRAGAPLIGALALARLLST